jgi:hypothetical protein
MKTRRLYNLDPHEISMVRRGANLKKILVHKALDGDSMLQGLLRAAQENGTMHTAMSDEQAAAVEEVMKAFGNSRRMAAARGQPPKPPRMPPTPAQPVPRVPPSPAVPAPRVAPAQAAAQPAVPAPAAPTAAPAQPVVAAADPATAPPVSPAVDPAADPNAQGAGMAPALSSPAQAALRATARILAPHKGELTADDVEEVLNAIGIACSPDDDQGDVASGGENDGDLLDGDPDYVALSLGDDVHVDVPMGGATGWAQKLRMKKPDEVQDDHHSGAMAAAKSAYVDALSKNGYKLSDKAKEPEEPSMSGEPVAKGDLDLSAFPAAQRTQMEAIFKGHTELVQTNKELIEKNAELSKQIAVERETRVMKAFEEKASAYDRLGAPKEKLAKILKTVSEANPEMQAELESILKSANEQLALGDDFGGIMEETGSRASGTPAGGSAQAKLDALADGYVAKSGEEDLSRAQVMRKVMKSAEGRRLVAEIDADNERMKRRLGRQ